ncbi:MAG: helix-turn-helix transcriptional regulator [Lachnospiraceae bacterium]|nr:helix-turn-helix transcriptional regulator [Lachnospiraceae bacterium]
MKKRGIVLSILGNNLRFLQEQKNLTQTEMARKTGLSQHIISEIEKKADPNPTLSTLRSISLAFHYSIDTLVNIDLRKEPDLFNLGVRKPTSGEKEFSYFEGNTYHVYYLSDRASERIYSGTIKFNDHFDSEHIFLAGRAYTAHTYDVRMVIEGNGSVYLYGTEENLPRRFYIALYYPDFRREETQYIGGIGMLNRLDTRKYHKAMKVAVSKKEIKDNAGLEKRLIFESAETIWISRDQDNNFRDWLREL